MPLVMNLAELSVQRCAERIDPLGSFHSFHALCGNFEGLVKPSLLQEHLQGRKLALTEVGRVVFRYARRVSVRR